MKIRRTKSWRTRRPRPYLDDMGLARRSGRINPVRRPSVLDQYPGEWVALLDDQVIAHSPSSREVVRQLKKYGSQADEAVLMKAASPRDALAVGLG